MPINLYRIKGDHRLLTAMFKWLNSSSILSCQYFARCTVSLLSLILVGCSTPESDFRVYRQSDGTIGVHAPKGATDSEAHEVAEAECKRLGKYSATMVDSRKTVNHRFPTNYIYVCR